MILVEFLDAIFVNAHMLEHRLIVEDIGARALLGDLDHTVQRRTGVLRVLPDERWVDQAHVLFHELVNDLAGSW